MGTRRKRSSASKTPGKAPAAGRLVAQSHGGAIKQGGNPGNAGGPGRPPSELRARLRGSLSDRIEVVESIADGEPTQQMELPLLEVMRHVRCPKCGEGMKTISKDVLEIMSIRVRVKVSASPRDRLSAIDLSAKYGLGVKDELSVVSADVLSRLERQAIRFVEELDPKALAIVRQITDDVWQ